jgi:hypothetical protein
LGLEQREDGDYSGFLFGFWLRGGQKTVASRTSSLFSVAENWEKRVAAVYRKERTREREREREREEFQFLQRKREMKLAYCKRESERRRKSKASLLARHERTERKPFLL